MKSHLKKASLLVTGIMVGGKLMAQTPDTTGSSSNYAQPFSGDLRTWSIGIHGGLLSPYTFIGSMGNQDFRSPHEQIGYGAYIKKQILPSFGLQADFLRGKVEGGAAQLTGSGNQPSSFSTDLNWSAALKAHFTLANINWRNKKSFIQPYLGVGSGVVAYKSTVNYADGTSATTTDKDRHEFFLPVEAGFKINLGPSVNLDLGYQVNFVNANSFDGYNYGDNNDRFSYAHVGLEFSLGKSSKPQMATYNPVNSMRTEYMNLTQNLQGELDAQKAENQQLRNDLNTTNANLAKLTQDSDGDGVFDINDKCPNTPSGTKVDGSGCPLAKPEVKVYVTEEDKRVVRDAIKNLEFDFGKATIRSTSNPSLDRVAQLLVNKNFSLKLAGHTDNVGSDAANLKLSKDRAEAIKAYLVSQGANPSRIEATGYGESQPIATNKTAAGRQQNRRVEFTLY
ncbi:OmpA family protein [Mucilaginibacter limnophilus]|uniref:OmpA family protein n=1 Tax=Mucilaginibacter limnophilus TaxID=1932778 RepID=A0A3S2ULS2_9SPHI|nr:OmpA family protein [Mucilaginibacter limnophilus]RVU00841.1 OmpA family protein [Mucilaginibacter limnophilus]